MDNVLDYGRLVEELLTKDAQRPHLGDVETLCLFDRDRGSYQVLVVGWERKRRVLGIVVFVRLRGGRISIEHDSMELPLATLLQDRGVPKEDIVLGFYGGRTPA